jgi:hypothetical protein
MTTHFLQSSRTLTQWCQHCLAQEDWLALQALIQLHPEEAGAWWRSSSDANGPVWYRALGATTHMYNGTVGYHSQHTPEAVIKVAMEDPVREGYWPSWTSNPSLEPATWLAAAAIAMGAPTQARWKFEEKEETAAALDFALAKGNRPMVQALLDHPDRSPDWWKKCPWESTQTWMHAIAKNERGSNLMRLALRAGADPNALNAEGLPPIALTVALPNVKMLLEHGADTTLPCNGKSLTTFWLDHVRATVGRRLNYDQHRVAECVDLINSLAPANTDRSSTFFEAIRLHHFDTLAKLWKDMGQDSVLDADTVAWRQPLARQAAGHPGGELSLLTKAVRHGPPFTTTNATIRMMSALAERWPAAALLEPGLGGVREGAWLWASLAHAEDFRQKTRRARRQYGSAHLPGLLSKTWVTLVAEGDPDLRGARMVDWWVEQQRLPLGPPRAAWNKTLVTEHLTLVDEYFFRNCRRAVGENASPEMGQLIAETLLLHPTQSRDRNTQWMSWIDDYPSLCGTAKARQAWVEVILQRFGDVVEGAGSWGGHQGWLSWLEHIPLTTLSKKAQDIVAQQAQKGKSWAIEWVQSTLHAGLGDAQASNSRKLRL